jgi:hypothetical protein
MPVTSVYLDECVDHYLVDRLRRRGYTVTAALEERMIGKSDEEQLTHATTLGAILLTHNGRHFRRLHAELLRLRHHHAGVLIVPRKPPVDLLEIRVALMLGWIATFPDHRSRMFTWGDLRQRIQEGYQPPEFGEADVHYALGR